MTVRVQSLHIRTNCYSHCFGLHECSLPCSIPFTLVSEPEDADGECLELGFGKLSVRDMFRARRDAENVALALMEREDGSGRLVGKLRLSVRCVSALRAIALELPPALVASAGLDVGSPNTNNLNRA